MDESAKQPEMCKVEVKSAQEYRRNSPASWTSWFTPADGRIVSTTWARNLCPTERRPSTIIHRACRLLYPGYFIRKRVDEINLDYYFGQEAVSFYEALAAQITLCVRHECLRYDWITPTGKTGASKRLSALCGRCPT